jgi:ribonuclease P protein component
VDLPVPPCPAQVGFAVSSRVFPKAVDRNRIKRLGREAWRLQKHVLYGFLEARGIGLQLFFVYTGREMPAFLPVNDKISVILSKLKKELGDRNGDHEPSEK